MSRIFMFSSMKCYGNSGGGAGVMYRLYKANIKYQIFPEIYWIYEDRIIKSYNDCGRVVKRDEIDNGKMSRLLSHIPGEFRGLLRIAKNLTLQAKIEIRIKFLNNKYEFNADDIFVFHDLQQADAFYKLFSYKKVIFIDHTQGGSYNEWSSMSGKFSLLLHNHYINRYKRAYKNSSLLGFPAEGAKKSLIDAEPSFTSEIEDAKCRFLYTGIEPIEFFPSDNDICLNKDYYVFITIANLNYSKGVERIPQYLNCLKKRGHKIQWILLGDGVYADKVYEEIKKNDLIDETEWKKNFIPHEQVLGFLKQADFYIIFHRYSVFDISILEAMHSRTIPILSPVGGNLDILSHKVGLLVSDFSDISSFEEKFNCIKNVEDEKSKVIELARDKFSDIAFCNRYKDVIEELDKI